MTKNEKKEKVLQQIERYISMMTRENDESALVGEIQYIEGMVESMFLLGFITPKEKEEIRKKAVGTFGEQANILSKR